MNPDVRNTLFRQLVSALEAASREIDPSSKAERLPYRWLQFLASDEMSEQMGDSQDLGSSRQIPLRDVPEGSEAWRLSLGDAGGRHFVIAATSSLKLSSGDAANALMAAVRLRSRLADEERSDLYLLLVSPPGHKGPEWDSSVRQIELNEAFCRVFVWSPSQSPDEWPAEARAFSRRLFLVRLSIAEGHRSDIAPISALFSTLPLPLPARREWERILLSENNLSSKVIADSLVAALSVEDQDGHE